LSHAVRLKVNEQEAILLRRKCVNIDRKSV
jgi:hypothetical protein